VALARLLSANLPLSSHLASSAQTNADSDLTAPLDKEISSKIGDAILRLAEFFGAWEVV